MAPKKSVSEDPRKKRLKSKAQRDEAPSLDNTFASSEHSVKLDLAFYIGWHMETCVKKKNGALPYGLQITTILNHFGVDLSGEKETRDVSHKDVYGETTMRQMRYEFKDDTWVKKNAPVMEQVGEEAQMMKLKLKLQGMKNQCKRIKSLQAHLLAPLVSMRTTSNSCLDVWTLWPLAWEIFKQA
uniref:Uncharacterized protein n=1 Tax=Fagus sylvatica TaxID=28930 RepID=A0A2N9G1F7_FAGSY